MSRTSRKRPIRSTLIFSVLLAAPLLGAQARGLDGEVKSRAAAVKRSAAVDCAKITPRAQSRRSFPRVTQSLARVGTPVKLNDVSTPPLTAGTWSPNGSSIAFVAPTDQVQAVKSEEDVLPDRSNAPARRRGVSVNEIWVYQFSSKKWAKVSDDGARPRFSPDGKRLLFISSSKGARAVDLATLAEEPVGNPEVGDPSKRFQTEVISDGTVLSPGQSGGGLLKHIGDSKSRWASIELAPQDEVRLAPNEKRLAVIYNADEKHPESAVVVYDKAGTETTVLRNCPGSALHLTWSQDGNSLAYPIRATGQPEIWVSSLSGGPPKAKVRLQPTEGIGAISLSPDSKMVAFAQTSHTGKETIWIANETGMQRVASGILAQWSVQGDRILYAVRRPEGGLDWYIVPVELQR